MYQTHDPTATLTIKPLDAHADQEREEPPMHDTT